jgi:hypothetical protein
MLLYLFVCILSKTIHSVIELARSTLEIEERKEKLIVGRHHQISFSSKMISNNKEGRENEGGEEG